MSYAHWSMRVVAYLIDVLACGAPNIIAGVFDPGHPGIQAGLGVLSLLLFAYNRWYLAGRTGQSWGKRLMDLRLIRLDGTEPVGVLRAFLRDLAHLLDSIPCYIGWFWPLWDRRRQTFADKVAATGVLAAEE